MTWSQWRAACQLLAEESPVGAPMRAQQLAERATEDEQVAATKAAIRKTMPVQAIAKQTVIDPRPITTEVLG